MENKFTLVVAVDNKHLHQFMYTYPNWIKYKDDLRNCKTVVIYDRTEINPRDQRLKKLGSINPNLSFFKWKSRKRYKSQRDKMLTALVSAPRFCVDTPWYIQIDTDAYTFNNDKWIDDAWFSSEYKFIANPWGYTKPANAIDRLDDWADNIIGLNHNPRLNYEYKEGSNKVWHKRIASWIICCNTEWCSKMVDLIDKNVYIDMPVVSQDTYFCYCADRRKELFLRYKFKRLLCKENYSYLD